MGSNLDKHYENFKGQCDFCIHKAMCHILEQNITQVHLIKVNRF